MSVDKFSDSLNLPKTEFKMKACLPEREPEELRCWRDIDVYALMLAKNAGKPLYILHDGPPYANGNIHLGHALNKVLKDIIVKFKNMTGFCAPFIPGWDTHGLPTELKAKAETEDYSSYSDIELRKVCKKTALSFVDIQRESFKRLGVFADWENPYVTLNPQFEAKQIEVFAEMVRGGAIYRGLKPVYWCSVCETALAEAEIEYGEDWCNSIFVKFKVRDDKGLFYKAGADLSNTYFVIWTTTAWTLPANVAICLNPDFEYSLVRCKREFYLIASALVERSLDLIGCGSDFEVIGKFTGKALENIEVFHPFLSRFSKIILGDHVILESGTGCVHTAPGHGPEDFEVCAKYKLPVVVPVDSKGILTEEAGVFSGINIDEANDAIIKHLRESGLLFAEKRIKHQYPHCWRCKHPVIFRATKQWFCSVETFKEKVMKEIDKVTWIPSWGRERIASMVRERSDWCISRQRKWGVPIPVFFCKKCGEALLDFGVMCGVAEIFSVEGSDSWYENPPEHFLKQGNVCKCGAKEFKKETDIMDVWFDSGVTHYAVLPEKHAQADLYLEGSDQYRGWFQSSLLTSVAVHSRAPYRTVLTHGWVVDEDGRKQSKSLGNGIDPKDVVNRYGADILRLWVASSDYTSDVKISQEILAQISESYRKIRNTARFILGNLYDFNPSVDLVDVKQFLPVDKFIILKTNELIRKCHEAYDNFEFHIVFHSVQKFCVLDLSNFYLDLIKDRLYVSAPEDFDRRSAQSALYIIVSSLTGILAPILSFTSEEIFEFLNVGEKSVFCTEFPKPVVLEVNEGFKAYWEKLIAISGDIKKELEEARKKKIIGSSLEAKVLIFCDDVSLKWIEESKEDIKMILIVSEIEVNHDLGKGKGKGKGLENWKGIGVEVQRASGRKCERCWMYGIFENEGQVLCKRCIEVLERRHI